MGTETPTLPQRVLAEFLGTFFLLAAIVGSGAMAQSLTDDVGLQLLMNAIAVTAALGTLIVTFGAISGAHFNPAVSLALFALRRIPAREAAVYAAAQVVGGALGVVAANVMFDLPAIVWSTHGRASGGELFAEGLATFGLILVILLVSRSHGIPVVAVAVAAYICGAFVFTSSTSFANPAVALARTLTDSFAGIAPSSVPAFLAVQLVGTGAAVAIFRALVTESSPAFADASAS